MEDFFSMQTAGMLLILLIIYFIVHSDYMVQVHLSKIEGATIGNYTTTYGTVIQGTMTVGLYFIAMLTASMLD